MNSYNVFVGYLKKVVKTKEEKCFLEHMERVEKIVFLYWYSN